MNINDLMNDEQYCDTGDDCAMSREEILDRVFEEGFDDGYDDGVNKNFIDIVDYTKDMITNYTEDSVDVYIEGYHRGLKDAIFENA